MNLDYFLDKTLSKKKKKTEPVKRPYVHLTNAGLQTLEWPLGSPGDGF